MSANAPAALHDFARLTPDCVLDALCHLGLPCDGRLAALSSYENRVYQVHLDDGSALVAKFYRPGRWSREQILEEHAFTAELTTAEVPVVGPVTLDGQTLHHHEGFDFSVSPRRGGRPPDLDDLEVVEWIGRYLGRIHTVGLARTFVHRPTLDVESFGREPREWLLGHDAIPLDMQAAWADVSEDAIQIIAESFDSILEKSLIRLHGDCHTGNILWTPLEVPAAQGPGPHFVDMDDARMGLAVQDLWMLQSGSRAERTRQWGALLDGYETFREFDRRELALVEPLRTLRLIHYSAWLARRWGDPTFQKNFPWFGSSDYWKGQCQMLQDQIEAMQDPPLSL
ncbi:MAG: hypothetical protein RLZZ126_78 [Pseudomonadota bacterium]